MPISPYMNLVYPTVSVTPGPQWASILNTAGLINIDAHDHTVGKGVLVPTAGININQDLSFVGYNAIDLRSTRYTPQVAPLGLVTDIGCLYVSGVDIWFNDGNGVQIQLTAGGALNAASIGGIGGDYTTSTASVFYTSASSTFTFWQNTNQAAILDVGPIILRKTTVASAGITLRPDNALTVGWTCSFPPAPPASTQAMVMDNAGNIGFSGSGAVTGPISSTDNAVVRFDGITGQIIQNSIVVIDDSGNISGVNNLTVGGQLTAVSTNASTANTFWETVTRPSGTSVGLRGVAISGESSLKDAPTSTPVALGVSATVITTGNPVSVGLTCDASQGYIEIRTLTGFGIGSGVTLSGVVRLKRASTIIYESTLNYYTAAAISANKSLLRIPPSSVNFIDNVGSGSHAYTCEILFPVGNGTIRIDNVKIFAYEL